MMVSRAIYSDGRISFNFIRFANVNAWDLLAEMLKEDGDVMIPKAGRKWKPKQTAIPNPNTENREKLS